MEQRKLGTQGLEVSALGLGCMGMSDFYGTAEERDEREAIATIDRAAELGVTMLDTADMYGPFTNEQLVGKALTGRRDQYVVATKFGFERQARRLADHQRPARSTCIAHATRRSSASTSTSSTSTTSTGSIARCPSRRRSARWPSSSQAGKVRFLGLSEAGPATIRRANAVHPISAVQSEYSLFSRDVEESVLPAMRELGIGFVAYSPLGRGILTGALNSDTLAASDTRRSRFPRFADGNLDANVAIAARLGDIAAEKGVTAAQLALAWLLHRGHRHRPDPGHQAAHPARGERRRGGHRARRRPTSPGSRPWSAPRACAGTATGTWPRSTADHALWSARA